MTRRLADGAIVAVLVTAAIWIGSTYAAAMRSGPMRTDSVGFNQRMFAAALMQACGRGLTTPALDGGVWPAPLAAFLNQTRDAVSCDELPATGTGLDGLQRSSRYLLLIVGAAFTMGGPQWSSIDALIAALFALSIAGAYASCRMAMGRVAAAAVAVLILCSPLHLQNLVDVRDYSKVPFFFATLVSVGVLTTRVLTARAVLMIAAATGALLAIGCGMRSDVAAYAVMFVVLTTSFLPGPWRSTLMLRFGAMAACAVGFAAVLLPVAGSYETNSSGWHVSLLGFARPWDEALGIASAPYELGHFYNDSYVASIVDAFWSRTTGNAAHISVGLPQYAEASRAYYLRLLSTFPADAILRAWASVIRVLELPFSGSATPIPGILPDWLTVTLTSMQKVLLPMESVAVPLFAAVLIAVHLHSSRRAWLLLAVTAGFAGYPWIQFQPRHYFHLEIFSLAVLAMAVNGTIDAVRVRAWRGVAGWNEARGTLRFAGAIAALVFLPLWAARAYQRNAAADIADSYRAARLEPAIDDELVDGDAIVMRSGLAARNVERSINSGMLVATLSGDCGADAVYLKVHYMTHDPLIDFSREFEVPAPPPGHTSQLFVPVYASGSTSPVPDLMAFDGITVPRANRGCVSSINRFAEPDRYALLLPMLLPDSRFAFPMHQRLRAFEGEAMAVDGRSTYRSEDVTFENTVVLGASAWAPPGGVSYNARIARVHADATVDVDGFAESSGSYLVAWQAAPLDAGQKIVVDGAVRRGGLTVGLVDDTGWVSRVDIDAAGEFRALVSAPRAGAYQLVIANHLHAGSLRNHFSLTRIRQAVSHLS